jgi:hypothetical protein
MQQTKKREIIEQALHEACAYIQNQLGVKTGDTAGLFFCGENEETVYEIFGRYLNEELRVKLPELTRTTDWEPMVGKYSFELDCVDVSNFIISDCSRFGVSPEKYGFVLVQNWEGSFVYSRDFMFKGEAVTLQIIDKSGEPVTDKTVYAIVNMFYTDTVDCIDSYIISR